MMFLGLFIMYFGYGLFYYGIENMHGRTVLLSDALGLPTQVKLGNQAA